MCSHVCLSKTGINTRFHGQFQSSSFPQKKNDFLLQLQAAVKLLARCTITNLALSQNKSIHVNLNIHKIEFCSAIVSINSTLKCKRYAFAWHHKNFSTFVKHYITILHMVRQTWPHGGLSSSYSQAESDPIICDQNLQSGHGHLHEQRHICAL